MIDIPEDVLKRTVFYREFKDLNDCITTIKALEKATPVTPTVDTPTVDTPTVVTVRKKGQWKPRDLTYGRSMFYCTNCEEAMEVPTGNGVPLYRYCPNCGARMEE